MKKCSTFTLTTLFVLFFAVFASAGDEALYEKDPPENAAFFRILNISGNGSVEVLAAGAKVATVEPLSVSPYGYSETTTTELTFNGTRFSAQTPPKSETTLVWDGSKVATISEEIFTNQKKARLKLFNLADTPVSLTTADQKTEVIPTVKPLSYGFRDVNALTMPFLIKTANESLLTTEEISLKKGSAFSIFLIKNGATNLSITSEEKR